MVGKSISHYQILEKLGEGGMGIVYKARDTHLNRPVALKVLPPEKVADPERKRRFVQEAQSASALNHPNIVHIYDIDQQDGVDYIAMEHVQGKTLGELIGRKGLKLGETLKYGVQIAEALAKAHAAGIVHRDLKPANVMVTPDGLVKVLDFGLAKLTEAAPLDEDGTTHTIRPATEEGTIVGTVAYMSPEQAEGKRLDARSDIFSFGAVLYEMVTGRQAFQKESKASTLGAIIHKDPEPLGPEVPHDLGKIVARCLHKDPAHRFQHMDDLKVALQELKEESDSGKLLAAPASRKSRRMAWLFASVAALIVVAGIWWLVSRNASAPPKYQLRQIATGKGASTLPAVSPDGQYVVYSSDRGGNRDLWIQPVKGGEPTGSPTPRLARPGRSSHPTEHKSSSNGLAAFVFCP
ncbi:MAG: protein kinase [Bryobacteraceae bacterium]